MRSPRQMLTVSSSSSSFSFSFLDFTLHSQALTHTWSHFLPFQFCPGGDRQEKAACKQTADCPPNQGGATSGAGDGAAERKEAVKCLAAKVSHVTDTHGEID